jgi:hypothetical protein
MRIAARVAALEQRIGEPDRRAERARRDALHIVLSLPLLDAADAIEHIPLTAEEAARIHDACRRYKNLPPLGTPP